MTHATDLLDGDEPTFSEVYNKGYQTGYGTACMHLNAGVTVRRERWLAVLWCAVGLLAGAYLRGWWV